MKRFIFQCFISMIALSSPLWAEEPIRHKMLLFDESRAQLLYVDQFHPEKNWTLKFLSDSAGENKNATNSYQWDSAWDGQLVGENRLLVAMPKKGGFCEIDLTTREISHETFHKEKYGETMTAVRFPDGKTALGGNIQGHIRIVLFDKERNEIKTLDFPKHHTIRQMRRTERGTLLFGANQTGIIETDLDGKIIRETQIPDAKYNYKTIELANGHFLSACGYACFLAEWDADGKIIKRYGGNPPPEGIVYIFMSGFQTLPDEHLLVATWTGHGANDSQKGQQLVEYDRDGKIVWTWHDSQLAGSINSVIILDNLDPQKFYDDTVFVKMK